MTGGKRRRNDGQTGDLTGLFSVISRPTAPLLQPRRRDDQQSRTEHELYDSLLAEDRRAPNIIESN